MLSWTIALLFVLALTIIYLLNKPTMSTMLVALMLTPRIMVNAGKIDGLYFVLVFFGMVILIKQKGKVAFVPGQFKNYFYLLVGLLSLYIFSWLVFNRNGGKDLIVAIVGSVKIALFVWELLESNRNLEEIDFDKEVIDFLLVLSVMNFAMVLYEILDGTGAARFLSNVYYNEGETIKLYGEYLVNGHINRFAGLCAYPMHLGLLASFALAYSVGRINDSRYKIKTIIVMMLALILGFCSCSKSFILGAVVVFVSYVVLSSGSYVMSGKKFMLLFLIVVGVVSLFVFYDGIYKFIYKYIGENYAYYFSFLKDWKGIFYGRSIVLATTIEVVKAHWILGVGVDSLVGERNIDNAYLMILHNGGIVALCSVFTFYFGVYKKVKRNMVCVMLLIILFAMGMGFQTLFATDLSLWVLVILMWKATFFEEGLERENELL